MKQADKTWTTLNLLAWTTGYLAEKGVENGRREAEWLLCAATGLDRVGLYLNFEKPLNDEELACYRSLVARRGRREPLQYILGSQEFDGLDFELTPHVLIPRHDTETLVEEAIRHAPHARSILDIGTGSGCIAIALARRLPDAAVTALDISADALAVASHNAEKHGVNITFVQGSFLEPVSGMKFDLIVSNPPYITSQEITTLQPEVRDYEPLLALDGGEDGLAAYRAIISDSIYCLNPGGWLIFEIGAGQSDEITIMLEKSGFNSIIGSTDSGGIVRTAGGRYGAC